MEKYIVVAKNLFSMKMFPKIIKADYISMHGLIIVRYPDS